MFPTRSEVELEVARYSGSPPFDIPFTFAIPGPGWYSAHLHAEFLDVMRFDGTDPVVPTRWVAWAHPDRLHGVTPRPATDITPHEAAAVVAANGDVEASPVTDFQFGGLTGAQVDVHAITDVPVFGGPAGNFVLQPSHDARLGFVTIDDELLIVLCLGAPTELDAACADAQAILETVQL